MIVLNTSQLSNDVKFVSDRCREFHKKANKSQYDLSDITGLSLNTIARLENDPANPLIWSKFSAIVLRLMFL